MEKYALPQMLEKATSSVSSTEEKDSTDVAPWVREFSDAVTQPLICPITHELMVDPVYAEDGHIYELSAIKKWMLQNSMSPCVPSFRLQKEFFFPVRIIQQLIETLVKFGVVDDTFAEEWKKNKKEFDLAKAEKMFKEGRIMDAAKLGFPKAQGEVSKWYFFATNGMEKDLPKSLEWARKAAEGGDRVSQIQMVDFYILGIPGVLDRDWSAALSFLVKLSKPGDREAEGLSYRLKTATELLVRLEDAQMNNQV
mmetsp:Transcript_7093/g.14780  ORF Transcript_7093/g.14780 Transcript_7093/m.14780 type:complete len:253 (-) Transcript_7093:80-838(-)